MHNRTFGIPIICWLIVGILWYAPRSFAQQVLELKPNLQPFPASDVALTRDSSGTKLRFSTTSWNRGDGPLELIAGETGPAGQNVYQRVYLSDGGFYDRLAGTFVWHPEHNHFHFDRYAVYTLQPFNAPGGSQKTSEKTTFCIMDTTKVNTRLPGAPNRPVYTTCNPDVQGMSVGWGDTYGWNLEGQSIDFTDNPSGVYKLTIEIDPDKQLLETNDVDNIACALLHINVTNLTVTVDSAGCDATGGEVVVSSIVPVMAQQGSVVNVTITGSGFAEGMTVSFENGSGPRPTANDVSVSNANTITATVTVKSSGPGRAQVWDVRVGSGVLVDGFTTTLP